MCLVDGARRDERDGRQEPGRHQPECGQTGRRDLRDGDLRAEFAAGDLTGPFDLRSMDVFQDVALAMRSSLLDSTTTSSVLQLLLAL